jgi:rod shape-determining protein MreD
VPDRGALLRWAGVLIAAVALQVALGEQLSIVGVHPELLLLVAVCAGTESGPGRGAVIGFVAGAAMDLFSAGYFGVTAISFAVAAYAAGSVTDAVVRPARWISVGIVAGASAVGVLAYAALSEILGGHTLGDPRLGVIVGIVSVVNGALALPGSAVARWAEGDPLRARIR